MQLSDLEFNSLKAGQNMVITRSMQQVDKTTSDLSIFVDTSYLPENHQKVIHEVVYTPKHMVYSRKLDYRLSMEWKTDMLLTPGDKVWVKYLAVIKAHTFTYRGETYYLIPYADVYLTIRPWVMEDDWCKLIIDPTAFDGLKWTLKQIMDIWRDKGRLITPKDKKSFHITDRQERQCELPENVIQKIEKQTEDYIIYSFWKVTMLNGFMLYEPIMESGVSKVLLTMEKPKLTMYGIIKYAGLPNKEYWDSTFFDDTYPRIGDKVHLRQKDNRELEDGLHSEFPDGGSYRITQRRRILGVIKK